MSSPAPRHREKAQVLDETALDRALTRIAHEILEKNGGAKDLAFVGLRSRGVSLAHRLAAKIAQIDGTTPPGRHARHHALPRRPGHARHARHPRHGHPVLDQGQDGDPRATTSSSPAARSARRSTRSSTSAGRPRSSSRAWSTAATASCRSGRTTSARTCRPSRRESVAVRLREDDGEDGVVIEEPEEA